MKEISMPKFKEELLDELLKEYKKPDDLIGGQGILNQLKKALLERALKGEMNHHLGYSKYSQEGKNTGNSRNGMSTKKIITEDGELNLEIPRDRNGDFEPQIIKKNQRRFDGFDDKILSMYARGMTVREIQAHLQEIYNIEVSPDLISTVTDEVITEVNEWNARPLDPIYLVLYMDALIVKVKDENQIKNKALYLAVGITTEGKKEVLGLWITVNEGAKFWLSVVAELKNRGVKDVFIACVDGLKGFPEAINSVFPATQVQLCIVHMIRNSLKFVSWKDRKILAADLKKVYTAINEQEALRELDLFCKKWDKQYPTVGKSWLANWANIAPFLTYPANIRKVIYTTNAIESINRSIRKVIKNRTIFPNDTAVFKLAYMALKNLAKKWTMSLHNWSMALNQFAILFEDRLQI
jgi:putative transposase